jgi:hypothetical protein
MTLPIPALTLGDGSAKEIPVTAEKTRTAERAPDASDIVGGPIGSAWLKDPAVSGPMGADLDALPEVDATTGDATPAGGGSTAPTDPPTPE